MRNLLVLLLLLLLALAAIAQPDPDAPPDANPPDQVRGGMPDQAMMIVELTRMLDMVSAATIATPQGVFVLRHGVLEKHSAKTLAVEGVLPLFGPTPVMPKNEAATLDLRHLVAMDLARRVLRPSHVVVGDDLVILIGAQFFRVHMPTFRVKTATVVLDPDPVARMLDTDANEMMDEFMIGSLFGGAPLTAQDGATLITTREQIVRVRLADGQVLGRAPLDKALAANLVAGERRFGGPPKPPDGPLKDGAVVVSLGTFVKDPAAGWLLKRHDGKLYELAAEQGAKLRARDDLATARILVKGKYRKPAANAPKDPAGAPIPTLDVTAFLPLGVAAAE